MDICVLDPENEEDQAMLMQFFQVLDETGRGYLHATDPQQPADRNVMPVVAPACGDGLCSEEEGACGNCSMDCFPQA